MLITYTLGTLGISNVNNPLNIGLFPVPNVPRPNAFTDQAIMVAARSGPPEKLGEWMSEVRNVREDFKKFFGVDITSLNGVAVMTDCDNSELPSSGYYKNIRFSAD